MEHLAQEILAVQRMQDEIEAHLDERITPAQLALRAFPRTMPPACFNGSRVSRRPTISGGCACRARPCGCATRAFA